MTKVCMIVHQYYYRDPRVRRYAEALADTGAQVDVLCPHDRNAPSMDQRNGVRVFTIPISRGYGKLALYPIEYGVAFILYSAWLLVLYVKNRYQVIHVHNMPDFLVFAALVPRMLGVKLILDVHDPMPEFYMSKYHRQPDGMLVRFMRVQERISSLLAHALITANSNFREKLVERSIPADKITVVNNIPDPTVFDRDEYEKDAGETRYFTLLYPGTIAPRYGLDVAIRALPLLATKIPAIRLLLVGSHVQYVDDLLMLARQLGVSPFVQFKPRIPVHEMPRLIIQADVGIYTALPDPHMSVATPTKVLEYAAMGIPIVASRLDVLESLFADSAIRFFEPGNVEQFADCIFDLFAHPARRDELVQNADKLFVRTHSWAHERSAYFDVMNHLLCPGQRCVAADERHTGSSKEVT